MKWRPRHIPAKPNQSGLTPFFLSCVNDSPFDDQKGNNKMTAKNVRSAASTNGSTSVANRTKMGANPKEINPKKSKIPTFRMGTSDVFDEFKEITVYGPST